MYTASDNTTASPSRSLSMRLRATELVPAACVYRYRLAGQFLDTDIPFPELASFLLEELEAPDSEQVIGPPVKPQNARRIYDGPGWIDNQWRDVECWASTRGYWIVVRGAGQFWVSATGENIAQLAADPSSQPGAVRVSMLGPVLILALALQGIWCLHASAVIIDRTAIAIVGESGSGKSTLAGFAAAHKPDVWRLITDDILPVRLERSELEALPRYPQLKLAPEAQPSLAHPERIPVRAIYVLAKTSPPKETQVEIRSFAAGQAVIALVGQTVAARLFDRPLRARHLEFCADAARTIVIRKLCYQHKIELLPRVSSLIEADARTLLHKSD